MLKHVLCMMRNKSDVHCVKWNISVSLHFLLSSQISSLNSLSYSAFWLLSFVQFPCSAWLLILDTPIVIAFKNYYCGAQGRWRGWKLYRLVDSFLRENFPFTPPDTIAVVSCAFSNGEKLTISTKSRIKMCKVQTTLAAITWPCIFLENVHTLLSFSQKKNHTGSRENPYRQ